MSSNDIELLVDFRSEVPAPDQATADRIYGLATAAPQAQAVGRGARRRRRLLGVAAGAVAVALCAIVADLTLTARSAPTAYAAAKKALTATAEAASGTITMSVAHGGSAETLDVTLWNGNDVAMQDGKILSPFQQLLLIGGGAYLQQQDGLWLHYASASKAGPVLARDIQVARANVAGSTPRQILRLATNVRKTTKPDGTTLYIGTIPNSSDVAARLITQDALLLKIGSLRSGNQPDAPGGYHNKLQLRMTVGRGGFVQHVSLTFRQQATGSSERNGTYTVDFGFSHLGSTSPITPPSLSTAGTPIAGKPGR